MTLAALPRLRTGVLAVATAVALFGLSRTLCAEVTDFDAIAHRYQSVRPLVVRYCADCHGRDLAEAEIDLDSFATFDAVRAQPRIWQKVRAMLASGQMPPQDSEQLADEERRQLETWVRDYLAAEAASRAGDPGPVALRRLNNAQYTYTIRELTGVEELDPVREFPADGAAGEGFTNAGAALAMSPGLVTKYLDAAKQIAEHAVLLPDGIRFSASTSRRDWTDERLAAIREFYNRYTAAGGGTTIDWRGVEVDTQFSGRLPIEDYLRATLIERETLAAGDESIAQVAARHGLNAKYLDLLWTALQARGDDTSVLIESLSERWRAADPEDAQRLAAEIESWQRALWKFNVVGQITRHLGSQQGPESWLERVSPIASRLDVRLKLEPPADGGDVVVYLTVGDAGDGNQQDYVVWENPRLVAPGRPDLALSDVRAAASALAALREQIAASAEQCLAIAAEINAPPDRSEIAALAEKHGVNAEILSAWLEFLGLSGGETRIDSHLTQRQEQSGDYDFVRGWVGANALGVLANSADRRVRIPGNMRPHSVAVHPSPSQRVIVGWQSPVADNLQIAGRVRHAHPECGNGVTWSVELRRGATRQQLAGGTTSGGKAITLGPFENIAVRPGDVVAIVIGPRDGNHSCDLTSVDLTLRGSQQEWDLAREISPDILAGNPHADAHGNPGVWHFFSEPEGAESRQAIPAGSLLAQWQAAKSLDEKATLAGKLSTLLAGQAEPPADSPDASLLGQLNSLSGPFAAAARTAMAAGDSSDAASNFGLDPALFGKHPAGLPVDANSLSVQAPSVIEVRLPGALVEGCELVTSGVLHAAAADQGSVQLQASTSRVEAAGLTPALPVIVSNDSPARHRFEKAFEALRELFPAAICYPRIVPVDEIITLNLFYREDEHLRRLMLDEQQAAELDRLWSELLFVSQEPLLMATAYEQLMQFATQDRPDKVEEFTPLEQAVLDRAEAFRQQMVDAEPRQLDGAVAFAHRAYRRPIADAEAAELRAFYQSLREQDHTHEEALRLVIARVLVSPAFLYRIETPAPGDQPAPLADYELATRLSYFLWSSPPDEKLLAAAAAGRLQDAATLRSEVARMLGDAKVRRLATEFASQWLQIYQFDELDEKSERHFPTFAALRGAMYEESLQFFTDLFARDGSVLDILDADYTFLNEELAALYGVPDVSGDQWRRVEGVRQYGRGGILTQAAILAKQSGASRTSPILRGNWLSEVVLGEKLPRPPKDVPTLDDAPPEGLTERQLIERHSSDPACAKCHERIDPFGFALENFDAIGRFRQQDAAGLAIDSQTELMDGTQIDGLAGLRDYLLNQRREAFVRQFNRKLLGFALGRSVALSDEPLLDEMQRALAENDYHVSAAIHTIVLSPQFRQIRGREQASGDREP